MRIVRTCCALFIACLIVWVNSAHCLGDGKSLQKDPVADLELVLSFSDNAPEVFLPGQDIPVDLKLINTSDSQAHWIVMPGDGSTFGWREPHIYLSAQYETKDGWENVTPRTLYRCGVYDANWMEDVVLLDAGKEVAFEKWPIVQPAFAYEIEKEGRYRIRAHYAYSAGNHADHELSRSSPPEQMADVEPFEIVSDWVVVTVKQQLVVELRTLKPSIQVDKEVVLSELFDIRIHNATDEAVSLHRFHTMLNRAELRFQTRDSMGNDFIWLRPKVVWVHKPSVPTAPAIELQPGEAFSVWERDEDGHGIDGRWTYPHVGKVKVRAGYVPDFRNDLGATWSDWVEVNVSR